MLDIFSIRLVIISNNSRVTCDIFLLHARKPSGIFINPLNEKKKSTNDTIEIRKIPTILRDVTPYA